MLDEIEAAAEAVEAALAKLRKTGAADGVEAVRKLLREDGVGHCIGRLDRALECSLVGLRPAEAELLKMVRAHIIGAVIGELLYAAGWDIGK